MGINYLVDGSTVYYGIDESTEIPQDDFFNSSNAQIGVSVIKIKDEESGKGVNPVGIADEVEIERR
jgi:hypothetical protein